ncbi:serine hydrolase domain-containing protein [Rheinheimera sp. 1928-s]|uniref:serine hydrolase domain-containing protein n=1 Tax=Rheinheimera sp. 1928-s TaxID=3033803 RepID=UPI0026387542|nr:serine hydrolase domain-containing protein [Rheinheimera sp. 1928-s]MDF3126127.1 serine hydrolase [Rheinheimera sp. 1928-s]
MKKFGLVVLAASACFVQAKSGVEQEQSTTELQASVEKALLLPVQFSKEKLKTFTVNERLSHHKVPAISFALIHKGELSWASGYGAISASSDQAITASTVFQAASIAKPVTAFAVMRMQDQGILDIDVSIENYLKSLTLAQGKQTAEAPVTFKNILDHSSGLTAGGYLGYEKGTEIPSDRQVFNGVKPATSKAASVEATPGTMVRYSGAGYTLAEITLSDMFGQPFERVMDDWVLSKLGMNHSSFAMDYPQKQGVQIALGHDSSGKTLTGGWRVHPEQAAAGLWSTPTDLAKLTIELSRAYKGKSKLLSQASAKKMLAPVMPDKDLSAEFGGQPAMTLIVAGAAEQFLFQHGGGNIGYRCLLVMYPETGDGAVFMTNSDAGYSVGLEMIRAASFVYNWPGFKPKAVDKRKVNLKEQTLFVGEYHFDSGWQADIVQTAQADGIAVKFPNGDIYPLTAVQGENTYLHEDTGVGVSFSITAGQPKILLYNQTAYKKH